MIVAWRNGMHRFLRAIGFSKQYSKQEIDQLLGYVMNEPV